MESMLPIHTVPPPLNGSVELDHKGQEFLVGCLTTKTMALGSDYIESMGLDDAQEYKF